MHVRIQIGYLDRNIELEEDRFDSIPADLARPRDFLQSLVDRAAAAVQLPGEPTPPVSSPLLAAAEELEKINRITETPSREVTDAEREFFQAHPVGDRIGVVAAVGSLTTHRARALFAEWLRSLAAEEGR
ncbi:hypothetical protein JL108_14435 [Aeromicrobium sp. YIM 150415]|uniref:hypothetical protein n=1 Tax=Aeromicrobium sp. YIM 150415 TaxID=2803912 RepID=UPI0019632C89|nr:hypothetical protein [Aeromicrobium sp. YIM 150415]MBM9464651.1 hypothetical protein [Aeromicrobium sp. YIM 150415]